jgi:flagellar biogenesis protein FliO
MIQILIASLALIISVFYIVKKIRKEFSSEAKGCSNCELTK